MTMCGWRHPIARRPPRRENRLRECCSRASLTQLTPWRTEAAGAAMRRTRDDVAGEPLVSELDPGDELYPSAGKCPIRARPRSPGDASARRLCHLSGVRTESRYVRRRAFRLLRCSSVKTPGISLVAPRRPSHRPPRRERDFGYGTLAAMGAGAETWSRWRIAVLVVPPLRTRHDSDPPRPGSAMQWRRPWQAIEPLASEGNWGVWSRRSCNRNHRRPPS